MYKITGTLTGGYYNKEYGLPMFEKYLKSKLK